SSIAPASTPRLGWAAGMSGVTSGTLDVIGPDAIQVAGVTYRLLTPDLLGGLSVGQHVTVVWDEREGQRQATKVILEPTSMTSLGPGVLAWRRRVLLRMLSMIDLRYPPCRAATGPTVALRQSLGFRAGRPETRNPSD